jgi:hypothetical protein
MIHKIICRASAMSNLFIFAKTRMNFVALLPVLSIWEGVIIQYKRL